MLFKQPSIYVFGIQIDEPVTSITALMVSAVCLYAYLKLSKTSTQSKAYLYIRYYFILMSAATAMGGIIGHAFLYQFTFDWKLFGWVTSMVSIMLIERASIECARHLISAKLARLFLWINFFELCLFITITMVSLNFFFVEAHTTYGLLIVVASLHIYIFRKARLQSSRLFLIAVGFAAISALIFMNQWGISPWFNHSDISHVILVITAWFFYRGALRIPTERTIVSN